MKIRKYKAFLILFFAFCIGILLVNFIVYKIYQQRIDTIPLTKVKSLFSVYDFDQVWQTVSYVSGFILILPAMLLIFLTTNEYTFRTNRQNIIDGWSRHHFFEAKILVATLLAAISVLMVVLTGMLFGLFGTQTFGLNGFYYIGFFFIKALSYNFVALLFSVLIQRTGFAIGLFYIYLFGENIISQLLSFWSYRMAENNQLNIGNLGNYLPMNASDALLQFPETPLNKITNGFSVTDSPNVILIISIAYLFIFYISIRKKLLQSDL